VVETSDAEIMVASVVRPVAFAAIFDRYGALMLSFLERRVGPDVAEDLLAELFRVAFERRSSFDPSRQDAAPWLYGIATNLLRRHRRSQERRLRAVARMLAESSLSTDDFTEELADRLDAVQRLPLVVAAIWDLPEPDREVLLLVAFEGLAHNDVADAMGIPEGTVKSRLNRARRVLRERLDDREQYQVKDQGGEVP